VRTLRLVRWLLLMVSLGPLASAQSGSEPLVETGPVASIPERPAVAMTGSAFAQATAGWSGADRQRAIVDELSRGNLPGFLRRMKPVHLTWKPLGTVNPIDVTFWVMPDYLAVGSDQDFLRVPLDLDAAVVVANRFGCILPTPKMVDAIYAQAEVRLKPTPKIPGPKMRSSAYYLEHQRAIERQRGARPLGQLTAGHKKDVVITNRLFSRPDRIAIYGWHRTKGDPIQPLSTIHGEHYADYSHGVRLVLATAAIGGREAPILEILQDPALAPLLTYEGVIRDPDRLMRH